MADSPEPTEDLDDEAPDDILDDAAIVHDSKTERLKVYASLLRATVPPIGRTTGIEGHVVELDECVETARNLAVESIFADIRRIAGAGIANGEGGGR